MVLICNVSRDVYFGCLANLKCLD